MPLLIAIFYIVPEIIPNTLRQYSVIIVLTFQSGRPDYVTHSGDWLEHN